MIFIRLLFHLENTCKSWRKPTSIAFKCNADVPIFNQNNSMGIGMVLRDSAGLFVACRTVTLAGVFQVKEAEAIGLLEALQLLCFLQYASVCFELDAN